MGAVESVIKHEPKASALSSLETATPSAVNSTMHDHVHINCCIVTLNVAKHYHGNIDDAFDLFLNFARSMDDSPSDLVAISPSLLESIDFNKPLDPVFDLGMAESISPP